MAVVVAGTESGMESGRVAKANMEARMVRGCQRRGGAKGQGSGAVSPGSLADPMYMCLGQQSAGPSGPRGLGMKPQQHGPPGLFITLLAWWFGKV